MIGTIGTLCLLLAAVSGGALVTDQFRSLPAVPLFLAKLGMAMGGLGWLGLWWAVDALGEARTRRWLVNLGLLAATIAVMAAAGELAVRAALSGVTTTSDNSSYFARRWQHEHVRLNSWGFREREFQLEKPAAAYRIGVIGDSITFGQGVPEDARFTNRLQRTLSRSGTRYEVLNFGRPGAETIDELATAEDVIAGAEPDFVLLQWFVNDVEGRGKSDRPGLLPLIPSATLSSLLRESSALYFLANLQWTNLQRAFQRTVLNGDTTGYVEYMNRRFADPNGRDAREYASVLKGFIQTCRRSGIPLGIVLFPRLEGGGELDYLLDRVLEVCRREAIPCLDLRPAYAAHQGGRALWVNRFDGHPNALAHRLAAERVLATFGKVWVEGPAT